MDTEQNHHHHMAVSKSGNLVQNSVPRGRTPMTIQHERWLSKQSIAFFIECNSCTALVCITSILTHELVSPLGKKIQFMFIFCSTASFMQNGIGVEVAAIVP
jgi:hypothetical protein